MATKVQNQRLLNVALALRNSPEPEDFTMNLFVRECGTPGCALGHYAARRDLQRAFKLVSYIGEHWNFAAGSYQPTIKYDIARATDAHNRQSSLGHDSAEVLEHFGITGHEAEELFGPFGCGDARAAKRAAGYIERFVARRQRA